jgi:hypothetical protein
MGSSIDHEFQRAIMRSLNPYFFDGGMYGKGEI